MYVEREKGLRRKKFEKKLIKIFSLFDTNGFFFVVFIISSTDFAHPAGRVKVCQRNA
jgi:hypothetical protein